MIIPQWPAPKNVHSLATDRERSSKLGMSLPPFSRLNLGDHVGDVPAHVHSNRQQLLSQLEKCDDVRWLQQIHGVECADASLISDGDKADASFTQKNNLACSVMTADCLPVLFCDLQGRQVAAAHAGWRGLAKGILRQTVTKFLDNDIPADQVIAWLGPAISQSAFEVGEEVQQAFLYDYKGNPWADESCFRAGEGDRLYANLYQLARLQLKSLGLSGVYGGDDRLCTYSSERFFSYRRESITGRQASLIWLE